MQTFTALLQGPRPPAVAVQQTYVRCNNCSCSAIAVDAVPLTRDKAPTTNTPALCVNCMTTATGLCAGCIANPGNPHPKLDF